MRKFILGSVFAIMFNYCLGSTYIIYKNLYKGSDKSCSN